VSELKNEHELRMWQEHGRAGAAIRISVAADRFCNHVKAQGHRVVHNHVTYEGQISMVFPNRHFLTRHELTAEEDKNHHFFFHKRGKFDWEQEFRVVVFSNEKTTVPLATEMVEKVTMSPLAKLDPALEQALRDRFGDRLVV
jgi:hypothetical protein